MKALAILALVLVPTLAHAGTLPCQLAEPGMVTVDGMLDEWDGIAPARAGGKDKDASFDVRCLYDGKQLALSVDVRDESLVRIYKAKGKRLLGEDRVEVKLTAGGKALTFLLFPGTERMAPRRLTGGIKGKKAPKWLKVEDTQQAKGWSIELQLPLAKIGGWTTASASVDATITFHDADVYKEAKTQASLPSSLELTLGDEVQLYDKFLADQGLRAKDVILDQVADLDPDHAGTERVIVAGGVVGLLGDGYSYASLAGSARDVLGAQVVDLRGDATRQVLVTVRQRGNGGSRDLAIVFGGAGGKPVQLFAIEIRKEADGNKLESALTVAKAGTRRKLKKGQKVAGQELVVEAKPAVGWDEDTFEEEPADDAEAIHLPWQAGRIGGVYWLDGDTLRVQAIAAKK